MLSSGSKRAQQTKGLNVVKETRYIERAEHLIALEPGTTIRGNLVKAYSIIGRQD